MIIRKGAATPSTSLIAFAKHVIYKDQLRHQNSTENVGVAIHFEWIRLLRNYLFMQFFDDWRETCGMNGAIKK